MVDLFELERYCNELLTVSAFSDYCPNGLQVDAGQLQVTRLVTGVTASQALVDAAIEARADLLLVHHGYFWRNEAAPLIGVKGKRIRSLMQSGVSLLAYHLPLDAHPELGNNRQLANRLGFEGAGLLDEGDPLLWSVQLPQPMQPAQLQSLLERRLDRLPMHLPGSTEQIRHVAWCTGAAQGAIEKAAAAGIDAFVSGEVSESTTHLAAELGIHYFAAGHHATERYGVQALGEHLSQRFQLEHLFLDLPNPV